MSLSQKKQIDKINSHNHTYIGIYIFLLTVHVRSCAKGRICQTKKGKWN